MAVLTFLQEGHCIRCLRLARSFGENADAIVVMAASIVFTEAVHSIRIYPHTSDFEKQCRAFLTPELQEINDRFDAFISRPLYQSFYLGQRNIYAGEYPGDRSEEQARVKVRQMIHFGVRHFVDLSEEGELRPYAYLLPKDCTYMRFPIRDCGVPHSIEDVERLLNRIRALSQRDDGYVYIHCWGGVGRTGTIVGCYLATDTYDATATIKSLRYYFSQMPKSAHRVTPDTKEQENFIRRYVDGMAERVRKRKERIKDCIRGCLMAGAAGDALGYPVEFMSRSSILSRYGKKGITQFELDKNGIALVSDDTQMTLFTLNGMLMGITRGCMRGVGGQPEGYVDGAYIDWYYTQTGIKNQLSGDSDFHYTWLRDLPELAHRRAPGTTCMGACASLLSRNLPQNNSKGCGGIMRVAPMGLCDAACQLWMGRSLYSTERLAEAGATIARTTHLHPLGYLPAALMTMLISRIVPLPPDEVKTCIDDIVNDGIDIMMKMYRDEYLEYKTVLKALTLKAVRFAHSNIPDVDAISQLGEGWTAEEAWAISLYCSIRHIDSMREAIAAAVNHDGDSDSTGSITGNIMGAIYGYEAVKKEHLFCPQSKDFESTIELSNIILALADDLCTGCRITEFTPIDTPERKQWYERYCEMKPSGI